jgi:hypothetical protein
MQRTTPKSNDSSFLAQDKVADFAKMAPEKVLEETIKAAGDPRLTKWHRALIDKGEKARILESVRLFLGRCNASFHLCFDAHLTDPRD